MSWESDYPEVAKIASEEGWDGDTLVLLLLAALDRNHRIPAAIRYLKEVQEEENLSAEVIEEVLEEERHG